jgi:hypothetical protein
VASPIRLIVIDGAHRLDRTCVELLAQWVHALKQTACLILLVETELTDSHPLTQLSANALVERFADPDEPASRGAGGFALVDAIATRDAAAALQVVQEQLATGKAILEIFGLLVWQLQRWLTVGQWMETGIPPDRIAQRVGLQRWQLERMQRVLVDRPLASLQWALQQCWEWDVAAKSGRVPIPRVALEQLIVTLCLPRTTWLGEASGGEMIHSGAQR